MTRNDTGSSTVFDNPVGWSRCAAGSTFRFLAVSGFHILMGAILVVVEGEGVLSFAIPVAALPVCYLYAMKRLLQELDQERQE